MEHGFHIRSSVGVLHPAALNDPPQSIRESNAICLIWLPRSHALEDCIHHIIIPHNILIRGLSQ